MSDTKKYLFAIFLVVIGLMIGDAVFLTYPSIGKAIFVLTGMITYALTWGRKEEEEEDGD